MRVILDATTLGLKEAIQNLDRAPELITAGLDAQMKRWYKVDFTPEVVRTIRSGSPQSRIPKNIGRYRQWKIEEYGIDHGLGSLTGELLKGVKKAHPRIKVTRGKEVRFSVDYKEPYYILYVHNGTRNHVGRPFIEVARDKQIKNLFRRVNNAFEGLDFTLPYPKLLSSVIGTRT